MIYASIYPRKSKQVDGSDSMQVQVDMCINYLDMKYGKGNYFYTIYDKDYGITGHSTKQRKDFLRMMDDVRAKKINLVVIQRYDRIARNTRDFCNLYHDMEQAGCNLVSVSQQIDTTTPYGKKFMYDQASMAELEWALNSERRKDANRYAVKIGKYTRPKHCVPFGYKIIKDDMRRLVIDSEKKDIVLDIMSQYRKNYNYCGTAKYIDDKYGILLTNKQIKKITSDPIYKGQYKDNPNFCEAYISSEEWEQMQKKKPLIRYDTKKKSEVLFTGMIRCPVCHRKIRGVGKKDRKGNYVRYYHCEYHSSRLCSFKRLVSEQSLETQLLANMEQYISAEKYKIVLAEQDQPSIKKDISKIEAEIDRLNTMFQKGRITEDKYDSEYLRLTQEKAEYEAYTKPQDHLDKVENVICGNWQEMYLYLDKLHRKLFWREIIQEIKVDADFNIVGIIFTN